jgi:TatD DNase family protein
MIDTHCHLTDPRLGDQLPSVLARAAAAGVGRMISIGTGLEDDLAVIALCAQLPNVRCAIGVHPNYTAEVELSELPRLRDMASDPCVVALGEMGLDYHYDRAPRDKQKAVFEFQLQLATELNRPGVIHCREATDDCLAILRNFASIRADFHCFTGSLAEAKQILDAGYMLGFTGPVTFKKNDELREVVRLTPVDRLLVETDAPYLTPEPMRKQKINEPALVVHVAKVVAQIKGVDYEEFNRIVERNATGFFGW